MKENLLKEFFSNPNDLLLNFILAFIFASLISFISYRFKFLSKSGSAAQFPLAFFIFGFGGLKWTIPILAFFLLSNIITKLRKNINKSVETYFQKSGERDYLQVLANGGIAGILVISEYFSGLKLLYIVYVSCIAAVCADTWGTEAGTLIKTRTVDIVSFRKVEQGISGGISLPGLAGALSGAMVIASSALIWIELDKFVYFVLITIAGFFGSLVDSLCGSLLQAQYKCSTCGKITENKIHCASESILFKGKKWINNDAVNFCAGLAGGIFSAIFNRFILNTK